MTMGPKFLTQDSDRSFDDLGIFIIESTMRIVKIIMDQILTTVVGVHGWSPFVVLYCYTAIKYSKLNKSTQWLEYMEGHERWWDAIWNAAAERGDEEVFSSVFSRWNAFILEVFGPPGPDF